jgi:sec-independent protein translocase protein TatC
LSHVDDEADIEASRAPLLDHLVELRKRLIVCAIAVAIGFVFCFIFSKQVFELLLRPLSLAAGLIAEQKLGHRGAFDLVLAVTGLHHVAAPAERMDVVFTGPLEFFFTKIKLSMFGAVAITFPILGWQLYRFVAPGLYRRERNAFLPFLVASPVLFLMGAALVYFIMLPFVLWFSLSQQFESASFNVKLLPKVSDYLNLTVQLLLAFGLCFQLPVVLTLAGQAGLISAQTLTKGRRYAFVGIIVASALMTPPDMISPFLLAIPIYGLYEVSIFCVKLIERRRERDDGQELAAAS